MDRMSARACYRAAAAELDAQVVGGTLANLDDPHHSFAQSKIRSEIVMNETTITDISPYRLSRFSDGSTIRRPEMM